MNIKPDTLTFCRSRNEWRWTLRAGNNRVIAASSEGYLDRRWCIANADRVLDLDCTGLATFTTRCYSPALVIEFEGKR